VKNCDLGLENAFSRPQSQFFSIRISEPANNIYLQNVLSYMYGNIIGRPVLNAQNFRRSLRCLLRRRDQEWGFINLI